MKHKSFFYFCLLLSPILLAQSPHQTVRGTILDADTYQPIVSATIKLEANVAQSSNAGEFRLEKVAVGRHQLEITTNGYGKVTIPILVEAGKEVILEIPLHIKSALFDTIMVKAARLTVTSPLSRHNITIEETLRLPATFYDPARMMATYAGVVAVNDQANHLSVRGNSPNHLSWRLEGAEVVNPNHTANAGTITDLPTLNGGGVNMLSAQLLSDSRFYKGNFPPNYGNVVGGLLDMRLRKGNDEQREFTGQIGLIGIDVATEGPISRSTKSSYLVNYRYSTLGLLSNLGVDLGDEQIKFQDASANLAFPTQRLGDFTVFGVWGSSSNLFRGQRDSSLWEEQKAAFDIDFTSETYMLGATHRVTIGQQGFWNTSFAYSKSSSEHRAVLFQPELVQNLPPALNTRRDYVLAPSKFSLNTTYSTTLNTRTWLSMGVSYLDNIWQGTIEERYPNSSKTTLLQPYANVKLRLGAQLTSNIGLHLLHVVGDKKWKPQLRLNLDYRLNEVHALALSAGMHTQVLYYGMLNTQQLEFGYGWSLNSFTTFRLEVYGQLLQNAPTGQSGNGLNLFEQAEQVFSDEQGKGRNYGVEASLERYIVDDYYFIATATLYESEFQDESDVWLDTRWNNKYAFNLTGGKEWTKQKKKVRRIFGLNARIAYGGGFRANRIDTANSDIFSTRYLDLNDFSTQYPDYFKLDMRLYWKRNKLKYNSMFAIDIQNVTNTRNVFFEYYDVVQQSIVRKNQLGIIPVLSWRIEL